MFRSLAALTLFAGLFACEARTHPESISNYIQETCLAESCQAAEACEDLFGKGLDADADCQDQAYTAAKCAAPEICQGKSAADYQVSCRDEEINYLDCLDRIRRFD